MVETIHHGSPQLFSAIFALNGIGLVVAGQANGFLLGRTSARRLLGAGVVASATGGFALLAVVVAGIGLAASSRPLRSRREPRLRLSERDRPRAGRPSVRRRQRVGSDRRLHFAVGAVAAPLVGVAGTDSAYPMAIVIATLGVASLVELRRVKNVPVNA